MKITGATSLLELQKLVHDENLDISCCFVGSAGCFRSLVVGPSEDDEHKPASGVGLGRDLGEAVAAAYENYRRVR